MDHIFKLFAVALCGILTQRHYCTNGQGYFFFNNMPKTRDEAQFCCNKYGMTLPMVDDPLENDLLRDFLQLNMFQSAWLGLFLDNNNETNPRLVWNSAQPLNYSNWNTGSISSVNDAVNGTAETDSLCVYGDVTNNFEWMVSQCDDKREFGCEIASPSGLPLQTNLTDVDCPDLLKMTARNVTRDGIRFEDDKAIAGTYGVFQKESIVASMGNQLGIVDKIRSPSECVLHCLTTSACNDIIILNSQICILYSI